MPATGTRTRTRLLTAALLTAGLLSACSGEASDLPGESSPPPEELSVQGEVEVTEVGLSNGPVVFTPGTPEHTPPPTDPDSRDRWVEETRAWLDRHLSDLEDGGEGLLADVAADGLLEQDQAVVDALTTGLASAERPVNGARYDLVLGVDGEVDWVRATVHASGEGGERVAEFVFTTGEQLTLVAGAAEPEEEG